CTFSSYDLGLTWYQTRENLAVYSIYKYVAEDTLICYGLERIETASELQFNVSFDGGQSVIEKRFPGIWNDATSARNDEKSINDHYFFNGRNGFLVGSDGNMLQTNDSGLSWLVVNCGVKDDLWDIEFINRSVGFVVGEFGRVLKTEDGGKTWRKTDSGTQETLYSIRFKNDAEGWAGTQNGLRFTVDGGETWQGFPLRYTHNIIRQIDFDKQGNGYAYTISGSFYWMSDIWELRAGSHVYLLRLKNESSHVPDHQAALNNLLLPVLLHQNHPNPFNTITQIQYHIPQSGHTMLRIINLQGQLVRTLVDEVQENGQHTVSWDGLSDMGNPVASGVYVYQLCGTAEVKNRKLLFLK
ncbi:T9SS type A sorting domain-containing protein, partial [candidate division KSB1 bacterium]|nr:T9SS type A sorting domain-containing protein [candidate division KSB1 bacterium]